jgi:hypothetical protein
VQIAGRTDGGLKLAVSDRDHTLTAFAHVGLAAKGGYIMHRLEEYSRTRERFDPYAVAYRCMSTRGFERAMARM